MPKQQLPYGSWPSPVSADALVAGASDPTDVWAEGGITLWSQARPDQAGRIQVVRCSPNGSVHDALPEGWNARTRAHEYGGGAWWVHAGTVFATSWVDQRLYRADPGRMPVPLTPEPIVPHGFRYADGRLTPDGSTVVCVREDHTPAGSGPDPQPVPPAQVRNEIVALAARPGDEGPAAPTVLVSGHDFVAAPRVSPDGRRLAWLTWEHPNMPWDSTVLWVADLITDGATPRLERARPVAGVPTGSPATDHVARVPAADGSTVSGMPPQPGGRTGAEESLVQPEWSPSGRLYVLSDRDNWWNLYRVDGLNAPGEGLPVLVAIHPIDADVARPAWQFGQSRYVVTADEVIWISYSSADGAHLLRLPGQAGVGSTTAAEVTPSTGTRDVPLPFVALDSLRLDGGRLVAVGSQDVAERVVVEFTVADQPALTVLRAPRDPAVAFGLAPEAISRPRLISFPSEDRTAYAWLYLPVSTDVEGPAGEPPPLLVTVHGGPTGAANPSFRAATQFWTSRGFAVADVDYGGSTGYGRAYRQLLDGSWGVTDIADVCAAAGWLAAQGLVSADRMAIRGSSAGGYTTLYTLATTDVFAAGASHYGIADLAALARDTHKFESRYLDRLVGPWPQAEAIYTERSPLQHVDGIDRPLIVLQGDEDPIVPPAQAELIVSALDARQVPHAYLVFTGEQHGFRLAENIVTAIHAELSFYGQVFGFTPAGDVPPVPVRQAERLSRQPG